MYVQVVCRILCGINKHFCFNQFHHFYPLSSVAPRCPSCQQPIARDKIVNDKGLQKEIQSLDVYCSNKDKGCDWQGTLKDFLVNRFLSFN